MKHESIIIAARELCRIRNVNPDDVPYSTISEYENSYLDLAVSEVIGGIKANEVQRAINHALNKETFVYGTTGC